MSKRDFPAPASPRSRSPAPCWPAPSPWPTPRVSVITQNCRSVITEKCRSNPQELLASCRRHPLPRPLPRLPPQGLLPLRGGRSHRRSQVPPCQGHQGRLPPRHLPAPLPARLRAPLQGAPPSPLRARHDQARRALPGGQERRQHDRTDRRHRADQRQGAFAERHRRTEGDRPRGDGQSALGPPPWNPAPRPLQRHRPPHPGRPRARKVQAHRGPLALTRAALLPRSRVKSAGRACGAICGPCALPSRTSVHASAAW
jgi:hypothetical protein